MKNKYGWGRFDFVSRLQAIVDGEQGDGHADDLLCESMATIDMVVLGS